MATEREIDYAAAYPASRARRQRGDDLNSRADALLNAPLIPRDGEADLRRVRKLCREYGRTPAERARFAAMLGVGGDPP